MGLNKDWVIIREGKRRDLEYEGGEDVTVVLKQGTKEIDLQIMWDKYQLVVK